jgi:hypothetical protein
MLEGAPEADVVVVAHRGFDDVASMALLREHAPLRRPIEVRVRRIARAEIPTDREGQVRWLDELWIDLDRELDASG